MRPPLNGEKTHPLSDHAFDVLRGLERFGPRPRQEINAGVANRFERGGLAETVRLPSPYITHKGRLIDFMAITDRGREAIQRGDRA